MLRRNCRRAVRSALSAGLLIGGAAGQAQAHEGGLGNEVMWQVCQDRQINDTCSFENANHELHRGTCQSMAGNLVCVRNQPIVSTAETDRPAHKHAAKTGSDSTPFPVAVSAPETDTEAESSELSMPVLGGILLSIFLLIAVSAKVIRSTPR